MSDVVSLFSATASLPRLAHLALNDNPIGSLGIEKLAAVLRTPAAAALRTLHVARTGMTTCHRELAPDGKRKPAAGPASLSGGRSLSGFSALVASMRHPARPFSLPVHSFHMRRDRVASLTTCRLHGAAKK